MTRPYNVYTIADYNAVLHLTSQKKFTQLQIERMTGVTRKEQKRWLKGPPPKKFQQQNTRGICPICEHRVPLPCVACRAIAWRSRHKKKGLAKRQKRTKHVASSTQ